MNQVTETWIARREKIEEEVRVEEEQEEEMSLLLDKEDNPQKEGNIPLIQKKRKGKGKQK